MSPSFPDVSPEWHEVTPGRFERGWDPMEKLMATFSSLGIHDLMCFRVKLGIGAGLHLVEAARKSWIALRSQHPSIASICDWDRKCFVYQTLKDNDLEQWLSTSFRVCGQVDADADAFLLDDDEYVVRLTVFPKTSEMVLKLPHIYGDGPGGMSLLASLVRGLASPPHVTFGTESENLSVALTTLLGVKETTVEDTERGKQIADFESQHQPSLGLPRRSPAFEDATTVSRKTLRRTHTFTLSETEQIIKTCKAAHLTPTHVYQSALIRATQRLAPIKSDMFTSSVVLNWVDKATPAFVAQREQGFGSSILMCAFPFSVVPGTKSLLELAAEVKKSYHDIVGDESSKGAYPPYILSSSTR